MLIAKKSVLKTGSYYESKQFYDACPETMDIPDFKTEFFEEEISANEVIPKYGIVPCRSYVGAARIIASVIPFLKKGRRMIAFFEEKGGTIYRICANCIQEDGIAEVTVQEATTSARYNPKDGVCYN